MLKCTEYGYLTVDGVPLWRCRLRIASTAAAGVTGGDPQPSSVVKDLASPQVWAQVAACDSDSIPSPEGIALGAAIKKINKNEQCGPQTPKTFTSGQARDLAVYCRLVLVIAHVYYR